MIGDDGKKLQRVGVVLASLGRPEELDLLLNRLSEQTLAPSVTVLSLTKEADAPSNAVERAKVVYGAAGLPAQRNRGLEAIAELCDVVVFFDDDYIPARTSIQGIAEFFTNNPDIVGATGELLADGVSRGGMPMSEAIALVDDFDRRASPASFHSAPRPDGLYGCNMAFRMQSIGETRFDEALPLYGWQEDMDFSFVIGKRGNLVKTNAFVGAHCGVMKARSPGLRLGYSQIANPTYLVRKGTMRFPFAFRLMIKNLIANHARCLFPEPWIDRKGRMMGNWLALRDLAIGKLRPDRILELRS